MTLQALKDACSKTHAAWGTARGQRATIQRRREDLRSEIEGFERSTEAVSLLPENERPTLPAHHPKRQAAMSAEFERLRVLEVEAEEAKERAFQALQSQVRQRFPGAIQRVQDANRESRQHLAELGRGVLEPYKKLIEARAAMVEADIELAELTGALAGSDGALIHQQKSEIRSVIDRGITDASDLEILGHFVASILEWSRRGSSPVEELWTELGLETLPGSVLHEGPRVGEVLMLRGRRLPRRTA